MAVPPPTNYTKLGDLVLSGLDKSNSELLALMYGSLVTQILKDVEDIQAANVELERLGAETGARLIEDFVAKAQLTGCSDFRETCEVIAKVGFKVFLGVAGDVTKEEQNGAICYISLAVNPLAEFVDLPRSMAGLQYNAYICGILRGALEQVNLRVQVTATKDVLTGADTNEFKLELIELMKEAFIDLEES